MPAATPPSSDETQGGPSSPCSYLQLSGPTNAEDPPAHDTLSYPRALSYGRSLRHHMTLLVPILHRIHD